MAADAPAASTPQPALQDSAMAPVDESRPTTTLQIRLADGLRITGERLQKPFSACLA